MTPMKHARASRRLPTLWFALGAALGCESAGARGDASDGHDHAHLGEVASSDAADASDGHAHDIATADAGSDAADGSDGARDRSRDLEILLGGWSSEQGRRAELRLVDTSGAIVSLVLLRAVTTGAERFVLDDVMGAAPARVDWFTDLDGDGRYGAPDVTSRAATPSEPPYLLRLAPGATPGAPAPLPAGRAPLVGHLVGFEVHVGVRFELRVTAVGSDRTVALFRDEAMSGAGSLDVHLPNVLVPGRAYRVFFFIDLNDNGVYDARGDHGSGIEGEATEAGLTFGHDHSTNRTWRM